MERGKRGRDGGRESEKRERMRGRAIEGWSENDG